MTEENSKGVGLFRNDRSRVSVKVDKANIDWSWNCIGIVVG